MSRERTASAATKKRRCCALCPIRPRYWPCCHPPSARQLRPPSSTSRTLSDLEHHEHRYQVGPSCADASAAATERGRLLAHAWRAPWPVAPPNRDQNTGSPTKGFFPLSADGAMPCHAMASRLTCARSRSSKIASSWRSLSSAWPAGWLDVRLPGLHASLGGTAAAARQKILLLHAPPLLVPMLSLFFLPLRQ